MYPFTVPSSPAGNTTASLVNHQPERSEESPTGNWRLIAFALLFLVLSFPLWFAASRLSADAPDAVAWPLQSAAATNASCPAALHETGNVFTLTILHTNDTWGYLDPCG